MDDEEWQLLLNDCQLATPTFSDERLMQVLQRKLPPTLPLPPTPTSYPYLLPLPPTPTTGGTTAAVRMASSSLSPRYCSKMPPTWLG